MVIDTSAAVAILLEEPEGDQFIDAIASDPVRLMSAVNVLEAAIVMEARKGPSGGREFDLLLHKAQVAIIPLQAEHVEEARAGWRRFGKGNHPAGLNFCDCCAYALSQISGEALLFKGRDFERTNVAHAIRAEGKERIMRIELQKTYYRQGFFNVPVEHDRFLGSHSSKIEIFIENADDPIQGIINRTAQRNGTARVLGYAGLRDYFESHFQPGAALFVAIESPQRLRIRAARP
jgi:ribonuclease VapC